MRYFISRLAATTVNVKRKAHRAIDKVATVLGEIIQGLFKDFHADPFSKHTTYPSDVLPRDFRVFNVPGIM